MYNKIRHSSRSSSNKRSKETPDQRCLPITILENGQKTYRQTDKKKKKKRKRKDKRLTKRRQKKKRQMKKRHMKIRQMKKSG